MLPKIDCIIDAHPITVNEHYQKSAMTLEQMATHYKVSKTWLINKIKFGETFND